MIYALGGFSGGLALYVKDGVLSYEYNLFEITRTHIKARDKLPVGKAKIEVETSYVERKPAGPLKVTVKVNGQEVASGMVPVSAPHWALPPMIASISGSTSVRRWGLSTTTRLRSSSTARSRAQA